MADKTKKVKRTLKGEVVSDKMQKTVVVRVERVKLDRLYRKRRKVSARYKADAPEGVYRVGDRVLIEESRPLSKEKKWRVVSKTK